MLEPDALKGARPVLRGGGAGDSTSLPDPASGLSRVKEGGTKSYTTHESLEEIMATLKQSLPGLIQLLHEGGPVPVLHPAVEMHSSLIARYERGEIVEKA